MLLSIKYVKICLTSFFIRELGVKMQQTCAIIISFCFIDKLCLCSHGYPGTHQSSFRLFGDHSASAA